MQRRERRRKKPKRERKRLSEDTQGAPRGIMSNGERSTMMVVAVGVDCGDVGIAAGVGEAAAVVRWEEQSRWFWGRSCQWWAAAWGDLVDGERC